MRRFFAAVRFFTIVPLPERWGGGEAELRNCLPAVPILGLLIGLAVAHLDLAWGRLLPSSVTSVLIVIALLSISGGLHIDGLADAADGFLSSRPRERVLEIMRDSRSGAMAIAVVVCVLALKIATLGELPQPVRWAVLVLMPLAGRCSMLIQHAVLPYARPEGGLPSIFGNARSWGNAVWALGLLAATGWLVAGQLGLAAAGATLLAVLLFSLYSHTRIGGLTGDTLGAGCELAEIVPALVAAAWLTGGLG